MSPGSGDTSTLFHVPPRLAGSLVLKGFGTAYDSIGDRSIGHRFDMRRERTEAEQQKPLRRMSDAAAFVLHRKKGG